METTAPESTESAWWNNGNLHDKTLGDWLDAQEDNRLATSLDILIAMKEDLGAQLEYSTGDELLYRVAEMVGCMDALASQIPSPGQIAVSEAALTAAHALGYLSREAILADASVPEQQEESSNQTAGSEQSMPPKSAKPGKKRRKRKKK